MSAYWHICLPVKMRFSAKEDKILFEQKFAKHFSFIKNKTSESSKRTCEFYELDKSILISQFKDYFLLLIDTIKEIYSTQEHAPCQQYDKYNHIIQKLSETDFSKSFGEIEDELQNIPKNCFMMYEDVFPVYAYKGYPLLGQSGNDSCISLITVATSPDKYQENSDFGGILNKVLEEQKKKIDSVLNEIVFVCAF